MSATIVRLGKTNYQVPRISFGALPIQKLPRDEAVRLLRHVIRRGTTFIDTAIGYSDSEEKIGLALTEGVDREAIILATKSMARDAAGIQEHVELSLSRTGLDRIHLYQLHAVNSFELLEQVLAPGGALEGLKRARDAGRIAHIGITGHRVDVLLEALKTGEFATVQAPYNFIEIEAERELIPLAREVDAGFIVMKPMGGGMLQSARLAVGYILQQTPDAILIPGFESMEEFEEMVALDTAPISLNSDELTAIESIKQELGRNFCRRCNYCGPSCPQEISIPLGMIMHTLLRRAGSSFFRREAGADALAKVESCSSCGTCEPRCPYNLPIRQILARNAATVREALIKEAQ